MTLNLLQRCKRSSCCLAKNQNGQCITVDKARGHSNNPITETKGTDKTITYSDKTITATVVVVEKDNALKL